MKQIYYLDGLGDCLDVCVWLSFIDGDPCATAELTELIEKFYYEN